MAVKVMTPVKGEVNKITGFAFEAATTAKDGLQVQLPRASDEYVVVLVQNTDAANAHDFTVKAPANGSYAASDSDETHNLAAGAFAIFRFESARWADKDGTMLFVPANAAVKAAVLY